MKFIQKRQEPEIFTFWKAQANDDWKPGFDILQSPEKPALHTSLLDEQGYVCCYCEARIEMQTSHLEHFRPQSKRPDIALEYTNLLASCGRPKNAARMPERCGVKKGDWYEEPVEENVASPLHEECEILFRYNGQGEILPTLDPGLAPKAQRTIDLLGLDLPLLNADRRAVIDGLLEATDDLTPDELNLFMSGVVQRDSDGKHGPFTTTLIYVGREYLGVSRSHSEPEPRSQM